MIISEPIFAVIPLSDLVVTHWNIGGVKLVIEEMFLQVCEGQQKDLIQMTQVFSIGETFEPLVLLCYQLLYMGKCVLSFSYGLMLSYSSMVLVFKNSPNTR